MFRTIIVSIRQALDNVRANFFHTFLSILGIVIGVGALVTILSLIDGMEKYAHDQISSTTSLEAVMVSAKTGDRVNGVLVRKDSVVNLTYDHFLQLKEKAGPETGAYATIDLNRVVSIPGDTVEVGTYVVAGAVPLSTHELKIASGRELTEADVTNAAPVIIINETLAKHLNRPTDALLGQSLTLDSLQLEIVGVIKNREEKDPPRAAIPITVLEAPYFQNNQLQLLFRAANVEQVNPLRDTLKAALSMYFPERMDDLNFIISESRVNQVERGFLLFRLIMGMIVGISVIVGGIGVMNVLLISVTERTKEIGLRKAMGAKRRDIILQFLAESVTVSALGSLMGLILGIAVSLLAVPIVKMIVDIPFSAAFTLGTMMVVATVAIFIGIVFGTYPALRAARLDPVEAIRRE